MRALDRAPSPSWRVCGDWLGSEEIRKETVAEMMLESHSKQKGNTIKGREESTQTACGVTQDAQN